MRTEPAYLLKITSKNSHMLIAHWLGVEQAGRRADMAERTAQCPGGPAAAPV